MVLSPDFFFGGTSQVYTIVDTATLDYYEGNLSVVRLLGHVRLHSAFIIHDPGTAAPPQEQVEVRAAIYKTTVQSQNVRYGICNPFLAEDKDQNRLVWSASWISSLDFVDPGSPSNYDTERHDFRLAEDSVQVYNTPMSQRVARVSVKRAIRLRGQERLIFTVAMGPVESTSPETWGVRLSGWGRMLIRH